MINFTDLKKASKPSNVVEPGTYIAEIKSAEQKISQNTGKPYLNVRYELANPIDLKVVGNMFDIFTEPTSDFVTWKLGRFLEAIEVNLEGELSFEDVAKLIVGKKFVIYTTTKTDDYGVKCVVDTNKSEAYYPLSHLSEVTGADDDQPF